MDGGVVEIGGRRAPIEIDDAAGPPRAWIAFLLTLLAGAAALLFFVLAVLPDRQAAARSLTVAELVVQQERTVLRQDIARLTAERAALAQERQRLAREAAPLPR